jgi:hypothetical protein
MLLFEHCLSAQCIVVDIKGKYVLPPVLFTLTQVVLLLIASTFTRVQIQSNLDTTEYIPRLSTGL